MNDPETLREARRWLRFAQEDLIAAALILDVPRIAPREVCWLARQAAEKALKAALTYGRIDFPRTHGLNALPNLLPSDCQTVRDHPYLALLTQWAIEARYPGDWAEPTSEDARSAVEQAEAIVSSLNADLGRQGFEDAGSC